MTVSIFPDMEFVLCRQIRQSAGWPNADHERVLDNRLRWTLSIAVFSERPFRAIRSASRSRHSWWQSV